MSIDVQTDIRNTCLYKGGHFAVLMAMADCANTASGEGIYPGIDLLAANARLEIRRTQDVIMDMRRDGVVVLVGRDGEDRAATVKPVGGRGRKTEYRIDLQRVQELQGLHEAEPGSCQFCEAREKRQEVRAGKGAISRRKGAEKSLKGAESELKGAIALSPIEDNPLEPSEEPTQPTAQAREVCGIDAALQVKKPPAQNYTDAFDRFWAEVKKWPEFTDTWKRPAWRVWDDLSAAGKLLMPVDMAAAARWYGAERRRLNDDAVAKRQTVQHTKQPANWLAEDWFLDGPDPAADGAPVMRVTLAKVDADALRGYGLDDAQIAAYFGDGEFHHDCGTFVAGTRTKARLIGEKSQLRAACARVLNLPKDQITIEYRQEMAA